MNTGARPAIDDAGLRERFAGELLRPEDAGYDAARAIWNGAIDRRPGLIARCSGTADVIAAVRFARERNLLVAVRGGGHNVAGTAVCDGGLVIDLSAMKGIRVDPAAGRAWAQPGVLWGELDHETQAFGLATTGGVVTHTGISGLTLGGGIGWLHRKHGLTVDNLLSADVVTADGRLLMASEDENPDLFWGLRGGGGNFGIVTSFEYRLHPVGPTVLAGPIFFSLDDAPKVIRFYRDFIASVPDEYMSVLNLRRAPAVPFIPEELHGEPVITVVSFFAGSIEAGEELVRPLRRVATPLVDLLEPKPYVMHQSMFNPTVPHGWHYYWKSQELAELTDGVVEVLLEHTRRITSPLSYTIIFQLGGAMSRVEEDATACSHRGLGHNVNVNSVWTPDDRDAEAHIAWARDFHADLERHGPGAVYVNFLGDEGHDRVVAAYGEAKYERLVALKRKYDPQNAFRLNQNINPEG
ncbi:MAG TPA: FAD-binding oxidoreductase [Actinomycetota bacterium]